MRIPDQLFITGLHDKTLDLSKIKKTIKETPQLGRAQYKPQPKGGTTILWTSTLVGKTSDWMRFCKDMEQYGSNWFGDKGVIFEVSSSARIYKIDSDEAWLDLGRKYGKIVNIKNFVIEVDWGLLQKEYDGVFHARGVGVWDAESTVWLNPSVLKIKRVVDLDMGCSIPSVIMASRVASRYLNL